MRFKFFSHYDGWIDTMKNYQVVATRPTTLCRGGRIYSYTIAFTAKATPEIKFFNKLQI